MTEKQKAMICGNCRYLKGKQHAEVYGLFCNAPELSTNAMMEIRIRLHRVRNCQKWNGFKVALMKSLTT